MAFRMGCSKLLQIALNRSDSLQIALNRSTPDTKKTPEPCNSDALFYMSRRTDERSKRRAMLVSAMPYKEEEDESQRAEIAEM